MTAGKTFYSPFLANAWVRRLDIRNVEDATCMPRVKV